MTDRPPCHGKTDLFVGTPADTASRSTQDPSIYDEAIALCADCPSVHRNPCIVQGVRYQDRNTIRAGLLLWQNEQFIQLKRLARK